MFLEIVFPMITNIRERPGAAKASDRQIELNPTGILSSTTTKTGDLEAGMRKAEDQASPRKRHYGPEKKKYQSNYTGLADLMAENPEKAIVRRFTHLNIKNLLYMQAELAYLEEDLNNAIEHDKSFDDTKDYARSWALLEESDPHPDMVPDHIRGADERRSRLEQSPSWQAAPVPAASEFSDQVQIDFDPFGSTPPADMAQESQSAKMSSKPSDEPEQLSDSERGKVDKSRHSKKSSQEPYTERPSSRSRKGKERTRHQDHDDHIRPGQLAQSAVLSTRPPHNDAPLLQRHLVHQIRTKLEKYNRALEQVAFNFGLAKPERTDIVDLQEWLRREEFGNGFLTEAEKEIWSTRYDHDRVSLSLKPGEYDDTFSTAVSNKVIAVLNWIYGFLGRKDSGQMFQWNDSWLFFTISLVSTILAACLPVLAILALYKLENVQKGWQIGIIGFFSAFCATALALAKARRTDVFLATAAFAAVMVVFIKA